jgi:hypothetical protein
MTLTLTSTDNCIVQVVQTVMTSATSVTSNGTEQEITGLRTVITPKYATSKILLQANISYGCYQTTYKGYFKRNGSIPSGSIGAADGSRQLGHTGFGFTHDTNQVDNASMFFLDDPNTTSELTYSFWFLNDNANAIFINRSSADQNNSIGGRLASTVTLMEITS